MADQTTTDNPTSGQTKPTIFSDGFQFGEFSALLAGLIPLVFVLLALIEATGLLWRPIAIGLYFLVFSVAILLLWAAGLGQELAKPGQEEVGVAIIAAAAILVIASFSQLVRYLNIQFGGFLANQTGYWHWLRFGIANVLEAILFDIPAIYKWNITEIEAVTFWSQTLLFIFRTSLEFLVVIQLVRALGFARKNWKKGVSGQPKHYFGFMFYDFGWLLVLVIWAIPLFVSIGAIANDGLSIQSTLSAFRFCFPVAFGIWLAWESLRAIFSVRGAWNVLFAVAGLICGIWLARANWFALKSFIGF
jgi:hypothetical protein